MSVGEAVNAPQSEQEEARLRELYAYRVLDTEREPAFDELVELAAGMFDVPVVQVNLIDVDRQWTKAGVGGLSIECAREESFCAHTLMEPERVLVVEDATADVRFVLNPSVVADPRIRFYAGAPLVSQSGLPLGALCVVDFVPRTLTSDDEGRLRVLARQVVAQLELRRRLDEESRRADELRELDRLRTDFVHTLVHELRNPIAVVKGYSELLLTGFRGPLTDGQAGAVEEVQRAAHELLGFTNQLLETAALVGGEVALDLHPADVVELVEEAVGRAQAIAAGNVELHVVTPSFAAARVDRRRIAQVLDNLLSNAVKYTPRGGRVSVRVNVDPVTVEVVDNGIGIPDAELPQLFEPFFRASTATDNGIPGTGLGLGVCKAIVEAHGGRLDVKSAAGQGTTVTFGLSQASPAGS